MAEDVHLNASAEPETSENNLSTEQENKIITKEVNDEIKRLTVELNYMHDENDRMKIAFDKEKDVLVVDNSDKVLQKEKELSATLQKLEIMEEEYRMNLQHVQNKLDDAFKLIAKQEQELNRKPDAPTCTIEAKGSGNDLQELREFKILLECEKEKNRLLTQAIQDKEMILERTAVTIDTQKDLVIAKDEIIKNLRNEIAVSKVSSCRPLQDANKRDDIMTSNILTTDKADGAKSDSAITTGNDVIFIEEKNFEEKDENLPPGVSECLNFLKCYADSGVVLSGLLLWANIQRKTTAENIWKRQALSHFTGEEITQAKIDLWNTVGENTLGKIKNRKGYGKYKTELDDIGSALTKLAEKGTLPIFLGTSDMVSKTPVFNVETDSCDNTVILNQLKILEESLNKSLPPAASQNDIIEGNELDNNENDNGAEPWNVVEYKKKNWKHTNLLTDSTTNTSHPVVSSPQVELVVYGVPKSMSDRELSGYARERGVNILNCVKLTTFEGALSFAFKITILSRDFEKAKSADVWPQGAGLRLYKRFNKKVAPLRSTTVKYDTSRGPSGVSRPIDGNGNINEYRGGKETFQFPNAYPSGTVNQGTLWPNSNGSWHSQNISVKDSSSLSTKPRYTQNSIHTPYSNSSWSNDGYADHSTNSSLNQGRNCFYDRNLVHNPNQSLFTTATEYFPVVMNPYDIQCRNDRRNVHFADAMTASMV